MEDEVINTQTNVETNTSTESVGEGTVQKSNDSNKELYDRIRFGKDSKESAPKTESNEFSGKEQKSADGQKDQKKENEIPRNKSHERIGELTRKYHTSKSELEKLRKEFEEYKKSSKPISRAETSSDEEYIAKITEQQVNDRIANEHMKRLENEAASAQNEAWNENIKSQVDNYDEFASKYTKYAPILSQHDQITTEYVMKSNVGPKMLKELFEKLEDQNFANAWFSMPSAKKNVLLFELEKHVTRPTTPQIQQKQSVPKTIVPGSGKVDQSEKTTAEQLYNKIRYGR